ncbi:MAG: hypothetical protein ACK58T_38465 [Phycisphaerae bacterium]|jgi:hypothetical protein
MKTSLIGMAMAAVLPAGLAVAQPTLTWDSRQVLGQIWGSWVDRTPPTAFAPWMNNALLESGGPGVPYAATVAYQESVITPMGFGCLADPISATALRGARPTSAGDNFGFFFYPSAGLRLVMRAELHGATASLSRNMEPFWSATQSVLLDEVLPAGYYELSVGAVVQSNASAAFRVLGRFVPSGSCLCDLNADGLVDDADFAIFADQYAESICTFLIPQSGPPCAADFTFDFVVDDDDFVVFAVAYDALLCQ